MKARILLLSVFLTLIFISPGISNICFVAPGENTDSTESSKVIIVDEHHFNEIPISKGNMNQIDSAVVEANYMEVGPIDVSEVITPLEETQTIVSYNKKGEAEAAFLVITEPGSDEIHQIVFMDKNHRDVYDVRTGMSGDEVKKLRKELKHMEHHGKIFLYDDQSNVMYLMDTKGFEGDKITAADVESMEVQAIIWKDKKHHK